MRNTRDRLDFLPLATLALSVATGSLTAQTRYLTQVTAPIDAVVSNGAQNSVFGFISNTTTGLLDTFQWNGSTWTLVNSAGPSARGGQAMAGAPSGGVIVFGGSGAAVTNATHHFIGGVWTTLNPTTSPPLRSSAGCAQLGNGNVVLFGGSNGVTAFGDTWVFDGTNCTNLNIPAPSVRAVPAKGAAVSASVLLFGGLDSSAFLQSDTWLFNGTSWTQLFPATTPPVRFVAALTADPKIALPGVANRTSVVLASGF